MAIPWTDAELNRLGVMRTSGCEPEEIAQARGRTKKAVAAKIGYLNLDPEERRRRQQKERNRSRPSRVIRAKPPKPERERLWNPQEIELLLSLRNEQKKSWAEISAIMGHSYAVVYSKWWYLTFSMTIPKEPVRSFNIIPDEVQQERINRMMSRPRDLTGAIFGDPPVGFSMLERRT